MEAGLLPELVAAFQKEQAMGEGIEEGGGKDGIDLYRPTIEAFASEITPREGEADPPLRLLLPPTPKDQPEKRSSPQLQLVSNTEGAAERRGSNTTPGASTPCTTTPSELTAEDSFFSLFDSVTPPLGTSPSGRGGDDGWADVSTLMRTLTRALDSSVQHSLQVSQTDTWHDPSESYARMAIAYSHVLELRTLWLLNLCEFHQGKQAWAEAAQCALMIAGIIMQALIHRGDPVWTPGHLALLRRLCPSLSETLDDSESRSSKISVDTALRYLQMGHRFAVKASLFHACTELMELQLPAYKSRGDYKQLARTHEMLREVYDALQDQEQDASFHDANYYRVGFYGPVFGPLDRIEFVYRESSAVRLGDMIERLGASTNAENRIGIITDARVVQNLPGGTSYLQITALEPVTEQQVNPGSSQANPPDKSIGSHMGVSEFYFDTGFVKDGSTPGGLETQWKRRTVVGVAGSFPSLVRRLKIVRSTVSEITPFENAVLIVSERTQVLRAEIERPLPVLTSVQRLLQGSVALQVNSGVLGICKAFLEPTRGLQEARLARSSAAVVDPGLEKLKAVVLDFVGVCKAAVKVHARMMGEEDQEFHVQLVQGLQGLIFEISAFIPTVLNQM